MTSRESDGSGPASSKESFQREKVVVRFEKSSLPLDAGRKDRCSARVREMRRSGRSAHVKGDTQFILPFMYT